jgi:transcriptional regulator with XRE-family HTH domain
LKRGSKLAGKGHRRGPLGKVRADGPSGLLPLVGEIVRDEREWQCLTQEELAAAARVSVRMLIRFEHESPDDIGLGFVERVADALGFPLDVLLKFARELRDDGQD